MGVTNFDSVATSLSTMTTIKANTGDATMAAADYEKNNTNTGASGTITLTLPAASAVAGKYCRVQLTVAQAVRLDPASTEKVYLGGDGVNGKYLDIAGVIGNYAEIYSDGSNYFVTGYSGVLTKEA